MTTIKKTMTRALLLTSAATSLAIAAPAFAQDNGQTSASTVDELVVTARRREENLQDVPIAVSALSGEKLEQIGAVNITALQETTPNATVQVARGSNSTLIAFIRGIGQQDPLWGFESGVGLYIDDVYVARPQGAVLDIYDVQRIEVLRGPQGTLYGRNTIGGAIKYVTAPITDAELKIKGEYGSYNERNLIMSAKTPMGDKWAAGITLARFLRDGFGENLNSGAEHYNKDIWTGRATLEFTPSDALFFRLSGDWLRDDSNAKHGTRLLPFINGAGVAVPGGEVLDNVYDTRAGIGDYNHVETSGISFLGQWDVNDQVTLKSISAYRAGKTDTVIDFDAMPENVLDIPAVYSDHQFTQEFQGVYTGERLQGVVGVYYLNSAAAGTFDTIVGRAGVNTATSGRLETKSWSVFGDFSYDVTDQLAVSVGGRWTKDDKTANQFRAIYLGAVRSPLLGGPARNPIAIRTNYTADESFSQFTPRLSVSYKFDPDLTGYASYSKGFKSGGFDMRGDAFLYPNTVNGFEPETADSFEVGLKGALLDRRLTFATDVFYTKYKDMQITTQYAMPAGIASVVDNVGSATLWGWEFEGRAHLTDWLSANLALGYISTEFNEYLAFIPGASGAQCSPNATVPPSPAGCSVDVADQRDIQNTPDWTGSFGLTFSHDLGDHGLITFTPRASYRGDSQMFEAATPLLDQQAYWLFDASVVWTSPDDRYTVGLHGHNLADEEYRVGGYVFPGALLGNSVTGFYGPPRTFTLSVGAKF
ncbi:MAG: TonB-dependent receptor [Caulobacteraceae bacterium]